MRNSNICAMLKDPLSQKELACRDCAAPLKLASATHIPAWLLQVRNPCDLSYDVWCGGAGPPALCQVHGCAHGVCLTRLCVSSTAVCADHLWECRIGVKAAALSTGFCVSCLTPVEGVETWILSSGHCACVACAEMVSRALSTPLKDPVPSCLSCLCTLHRPYKFGLDRQVRCGTCSPLLPSVGVLFEDMVARLVLVWLDVCHLCWPARFMAAGHLFPRKIGRRLASACVSELYQHEMPAVDALRPVALRRVAPLFAATTLRLAP